VRVAKHPHFCEGRVALQVSVLFKKNPSLGNVERFIEVGKARGKRRKILGML